MLVARLSHSTGLPLLDAQTDFSRARRAYHVAKMRAWLRGSCWRLRSLAPSALLAAGPTRLEVVPLHAVIGTIDATINFDTDFRPASNALRHRWERIALAHRRGDALPPVVLRRQPDGYYVVDGRHRISVARALRHRDIDAWVSGPSILTPTVAPPGGSSDSIAARRGSPCGRRQRG